MLLAGCALSPGGTAPAIAIAQLVGDDWVEVTDRVLLAETEGFTLRIEGSASGGISSFVVTQGDEQLAPQFDKALSLWTAQQVFTIVEPVELLQFRLLDRKLDEAFRVLHVYLAPDILDQVLVAGTRADRMQSHWVNDPMHLIVTLNQGIAGTYELTVQAERWDGSAYVLESDFAAYTTSLAFPGTRGRYRYTVRAADAATGYQEEATFVAYVHEVTVTAGGTIVDTNGSTTDIEDNHDSGGAKDISLDWGDLNGAMEAGYEWQVELRADTPALNTGFTTGTTGVADFRDVGAYRLRVGLRALPTDPFTYTTDLATGHVGLNRPPGSPVLDTAPGTLDETASVAVTFSVAAAPADDPDGDTVTYIVDNGTFPMTIGYDATTRVYSWDLPTGGPDPDGTFDASTGDFAWTIPANTFDDADSYTLSFWAVDPFGSVSPETTVTFQF